jgi:small subunit ribosomal protein S8
MIVTDPIADMLTRIRNALIAKHTKVEMPSSIMKEAIAKILTDEGYINGFEINEGGVQSSMVVSLKYANRKGVITGLRRISKPGLRVYAQSDDLPKVLNGLGIAIISTSKGVMTDREARKINQGGEVLAYVW